MYNTAKWVAVVIGVFVVLDLAYAFHPSTKLKEGESVDLSPLGILTRMYKGFLIILHIACIGLVLNVVISSCLGI